MQLFMPYEHAQVQPFMTVLVLPKDKTGFKGCAINFPNDVVERVTSLPNSAAVSLSILLFRRHDGYHFS